MQDERWLCTPSFRPICLELIASLRRKCSSHRYVQIRSQTVSFNPETFWITQIVFDLLSLSHTHTHTHTLSLSLSLSLRVCVCVCVRVHVSLNIHILKFEIELCKNNETVSYKFSLYCVCVGVTFGHVELTVVNVDIAIWAGSVKIYRFMQHWILKTDWLWFDLKMWSRSLKWFERVRLSEYYH